MSASVLLRTLWGFSSPHVRPRPRPAEKFHEAWGPKWGQKCCPLASPEASWGLRPPTLTRRVSSSVRRANIEWPLYPVSEWPLACLWTRRVYTWFSNTACIWCLTEEPESTSCAKDFAFYFVQIGALLTELRQFSYSIYSENCCTLFNIV